MHSKALKIAPGDNVAVALHDLAPGEEILLDDARVKVVNAISSKHKFALEDLHAESLVIMYGLVVGKTRNPIRRGEAVTTSNVVHETKPFEVRKNSFEWKAPDISPFAGRTFNGYHRSDGQVGTRNFWLVVPLVFCENRNVEFLKNALVNKLGYGAYDRYDDLVESLMTGKKDVAVSREKLPARPRHFANIDGIKFLTHDGGCGGTREDSDNLCRLIAGYLKNPNVAGATILSLGCQHAQATILRGYLREYNVPAEKEVLFYEHQHFASEDQLITQAIVDTYGALARANAAGRRPAPLSSLCVGLKCGGSDGFSGITANPAMGYVSDLIAALKGRTILAEFPELCGVEQDIIDRSTDTALAEKFVRLMTSYNARAEAHGSGFSMNPSPGNIKDGLITDAMKSAGAAKKGGTSPVTGVLDYTEYATVPGLNLLCTPGNDVEATTGMAGSGANLIIFSTGLGTPTGNPVAPVIKTSTNSRLRERMTDIIDFDHGDIVTDGKSIEQSGRELMELIIRTASGEHVTCSERLRQDDFIPWKRGVSL